MAIQRTFPNELGIAFSGLNACKKYLADHGFSIGSMQRDYPMAVQKGDVMIAKWKNLNHYEKQLVDGVVEAVGGFRMGAARLTLSDSVAPQDMQVTPEVA